MKISIDSSRLFKSVSFAISGLKHAFRREQNLRLEFFSLIFACLLSLIFKISLIEWIWVLMSAFMVLISELLNTAIERLTDLVSDKRKTGLARQAKDIAAGAVFLSVVQSLIAGLIIFLPKILKIIHH